MTEYIILACTHSPSPQEKLAEADKNAKKKDVPLGMLKADGSSKRYGSRAVCAFAFIHAIAEDTGPY